MIPSITMQPGLEILLKAHESALDLHIEPKKVAVPIKRLEEAGLSRENLRCLICGRYVAQTKKGPSRDKNPQGAGSPGEKKTLRGEFFLTSHGAEFAQTLLNSRRVAERGTSFPIPGFRKPSVKPALASKQVWGRFLKIDKKARASGHPLLTEAGLVYVGLHLRPTQKKAQKGKKGAPRVPEMGKGKQKPRWDSEGRRLWLGKLLLKEFRQPAPNQTLLLEAFQEQSFGGEHLDDPLPRAQEENDEDAQRRLHETIKDLNRGILPGTIRFRGDGTGQGVRWEYDLRE